MVTRTAARPEPEFLFDFGSPNAFLSYRVLPAIEARTGARFTYVPALLGGIFKATGNQSPIMTYANIPARLAYDNLEIARFVARHDIEGFAINPHFPVNTLLVMRGAVAARSLGLLAPYVDAVFDAMWIAGEKMDEEAVVRDVLAARGLPEDELLALAKDPAIKQALLTDTEHAVARGVFGSPSFFVGEDLYFGKDRLRDVEEAIAASGRD